VPVFRRQANKKRGGVIDFYLCSTARTAWAGVGIRDGPGRYSLTIAGRINLHSPVAANKGCLDVPGSLLKLLEAALTNCGAAYGPLSFRRERACTATRQARQPPWLRGHMQGKRGSPGQHSIRTSQRGHIEA
jgi:hypothetical protein